MSVINLPVSLGEALDKLSILDIKVEKIKDEVKRKECQKEKDALYTQLQTYVQDFSFWYNALKAVNTEIWDSQDILRTMETKEELGKKVLEINDMRFRIKNKINTYSSSFLKEQKGYHNKILVIETPIFLQEIFKWRKIFYYLSIDYDHVYFVPSNFRFSELFEPNIHLISESEIPFLKQQKGTHIYNEGFGEAMIKNLNLYPSILNVLEPKSAVFFCHIGLGDIINMNGAVNYLSKKHDDLYLITYKHNYNATRLLFNTNYKVKIIDVYHEDDIWINDDYKYFRPLFKEIFTYFTKVYRSGIYLDKSKPCINLPLCFYDDLKLAHDIRFSHFRLPEIPESREMYKLIKEKRYIFVGQKCSAKTLNLVSWDKHKILTLDPNINMYEKTDAFYNVAEQFVNKPFFYYIDTIQNATELHLIDSAFAVLACYIPDLKANIKIIYDREDGRKTNYFMPVFEKEMNQICKKYNIVPFVDNSLRGKAMGLGDILNNICGVKQGLLNTPILVNISLFNISYDNPANAFEFRIKFIRDLLQCNNLPPDIFKYIQSSNDDTDQDYEFDKISFDPLQFNTPPLPDFLKDNQYIVFHTKCRHTKKIDYEILKEHIQQFCEHYETTLPIVLLGERVFPDTYEYRVHGITTIYSELESLKKNNTVYDLTEIELFNSLDYEHFKKDLAIIKGAQLNVSFGLGGPLCFSMAFGRKTIAFVHGSDEIFYNKEKLEKNNIFYQEHLSKFFMQILEHKSS